MHSFLFTVFTVLMILSTGTRAHALGYPNQLRPAKMPRRTVWCATLLKVQRAVNVPPIKEGQNLVQVSSERLAVHLNDAPDNEASVADDHRESGVVIPNLLQPEDAVGDWSRAQYDLEQLATELAGPSDGHAPKLQIITGRESISNYLNQVVDTAVRANVNVAPPEVYKGEGLNLTRAKHYRADVARLGASIFLNLGSAAGAAYALHGGHGLLGLGGVVATVASGFLIKHALQRLHSSALSRKVLEYHEPARGLLNFTDGVLDILDQPESTWPNAFASFSARIQVPRDGHGERRVESQHILRALQRLVRGEHFGEATIKVDQIFTFDSTHGQPVLLTVIRQ